MADAVPSMKMMAWIELPSEAPVAVEMISNARAGAASRRRRNSVQNDFDLLAATGPLVQLGSPGEERREDV